MTLSLYWDFISNSIPVIIASDFESIIENVNMHYATNDEMMAGIGLATILVHFSGGSILHGFNVGYCNMASRAYGARNKTKYKQTLIQGITNLGLFLVLFILISLFSYKLTKITGQSEVICNYAYWTMIYHLPGLCCYFVCDFFMSYLNSQKVFKPILWMFISTFIFHVLLSFLISKPFGFNGIVITTNLTFLFMLIVTVLMARYSTQWQLNLSMLQIENKYEDYKTFTKECLYVGLPYLMHNLIFLFITLYLGSFKLNDQTTINAAALNMEALVVAPIVGFSIYGMTRMSHFIGENQPQKVKKIIQVIVIISFVTVYLTYILIQIFRENVAAYYFKDKSLYNTFFVILNFLYFRGFISSWKVNGSFILRGLGMGIKLLISGLICYYFIGMISVVLFGRRMEQKSLAVLSGMLIGEIILSVYLLYEICKIDIEEKTNELYEKVKVKEMQQVPHVDNVD